MHQFYLSDPIYTVTDKTVSMFATFELINI